MGNKRYKRPESISRKQWLGANKNGRFLFALSQERTYSGFGTR